MVHESSGLLEDPHEDINIHTIDKSISGTTSLVPLEASPLGRHIGVYSALVLFCGRMGGSAIFAAPGLVFRDVGQSPLLFFITWIIGGLIAFSGLSVYLELGSFIPRSGATKVFLEFIFPYPRYFTSIVFGIFTVLFSLSSTNAIVFGNYLRFMLELPEDEYESRKLAVLLIIVIVLLHGYSKRIGMLIQNVIGTIKLSLLAIMIMIGFWVLIIPQSITGIQNQLTWTTLLQPPKTAVSPFIYASALLKCIHTFGGWTTAHAVQNEIKDPIQTLKKTAPFSLLLIFVTYMSMNLAYLMVLPHEQIVGGGISIGGLLFSKLFGEYIGTKLLGLFVVICAAGNVLVVVYSDSRLNQEVAREGFLPFSKLLSSNKPWGTPFAGLILHGIISCMVIILPASGDIYNYIVSIQIYPNQFFHAILCIGLYRLRTTFPNVKAPLQSNNIMIIFCFLSSTWIVIAPFIPNTIKSSTGYPSYAIAGFSILAFGALYWFVLVRVLPYFGKYTIFRATRILDDGLVVKQWRKTNLYTTS